MYFNQKESESAIIPLFPSCISIFENNFDLDNLEHSNFNKHGYLIELKIHLERYKKITSSLSYNLCFLTVLFFDKYRKNSI